MLSQFRRLSKSKVGTTIMVLFVVAIMGSFAMADVNGLRQGAFGMGSGTLARAGGETVSERDLNDVFERALNQARQQNPEATPATLAGDFDQLLNELVDERVLAAFAADQHVVLSRRLVDAEIAKLPNTKGLDGKFSQVAYQQFLAQQRLSDQMVRRLLGGDLTQRLLLGPVAVNARVPVGVATPYASMLMEQRSGQVALVMTDAFKGGLVPSAGDLQAYYDANKSRYMVPEQRILRIATIAADKIAVPAPTDAEIAAAYKANPKYGGKQSRVISQAVLPSKAAADALAARARGGATFAAAAAPAGFSAEDVSVGPQTRAEFTTLAGPAVTAAAFAAPPGAIIGPIKSDLGWHVIKIDGVQRTAPTPIAAARAEIVTALTDEKRKDAVADFVAKVEDAIAGGSSLPDAAKASGLTVTETPPLTGSGKSLANPAFALPADYAPVIKSGFELAPEDDPVVEELTNKKDYALVGIGRLIPAAPAPLASIRERVVADWVQKKASDLARAAAAGIAAKAARGVPLAQATAEAGKGAVPPRPIVARRIEIAQAKADVAAPIRMLFSLGAGKSRMVADPQDRGYYIVRNDKIVPGNAGADPGLVAQVQIAFQKSVGEELAQQFLSAVRKDVGVKRDDKAIAAAKARLTQGSE